MRLFLMTSMIVVVSSLVAFCSPENPLESNKSTESETEKPFVHLVKIEGAITPASLEILENAVDLAENDGARALIIQLDTPGGLVLSMDGMIRRILSSKVPILTYVGPAGASCGSAGVYIMYSSHVAAMASATNIGSATPVSLSPSGESQPSTGDSTIPKEAGVDDSVNLKRKQINHAIGQIRSLAEYHKRNPTFAEKSISEAANITSIEAQRTGVIDLLAETPEELLAKADGRQVRMLTETRTLDLKDTEIREIESDFRSNFLSVLTNPAVASILMMIGVLGILVEVQYPGTVFPGVIGAICLLLGLYAMQSLPVNYAGMGLLILGVIFLILEVKVVSYGMLSVAGIVCFTLGAVMLVRSAGDIAYATLFTIIGSGVAIAGTMAFVIYKARESQRKAVVSGSEQTLSEIGVTLSEVTDRGGRIRLHSEIWFAKSESGEIAEGKQVNVLRREGMQLIVKEV